MAKDVEFAGQSGRRWRYWTDQPLGRPGGFGGVFAAEAADGTPMAVKVVEKTRPSGTLDDRLLRREIEIGRRVADSGSDLLLPVIDVAEINDKLLLVMVRADGALADGALPLDEATAIGVMTEIAAGLQDLHSIGIIHRDLKPANVLKHDKRWKLADFGISRDEEIGTQNPTFIGWGSAPYMAPEIWEGRSPTVKTDLYALGCVGFQLLSGTTPFTGDRPALRVAHLSQSVPEVPTANVALRNLITRLLAKDPGERPQDARAVLDRLQRAAMSRSPVQEAIARGIGVHAAERSQEASRRAAQEAAQEARRQQIAQAQADLDEILADALEALQQIEPEATLQTPRPVGGGTHTPGRSSITLATADATLRIDTWEQGSYGVVPGDTMVLASAVVIMNRCYDRELRAANLVYEQIGDRLGWQVYRFRPGMVAPDKYPYGPYGRMHGLSHEDFFGQWGRYFMVNPAMHVWQKSVVQLTPETLLDLFREAIDLRPPDPRTGIWHDA
jgi:Protein kinase domain